MKEIYLNDRGTNLSRKKSDQITSQKWQLLWLPLKLGIHGVITFVFILLFKHFMNVDDI
ncbi:MAG: hypothetical protein WCA39_13045 [Nitrososphaeraceae archaeon]